MKYKFFFIFFICFISCVTAFPLFGKKERYIIQLKKPDSIEILCAQDDKIKAFSHLRKQIKKVFSFGKFEGFVGEFSKDVIDRISTNPLIESITQDLSIQASDEIVVQDDASFHLVRLSQEGPVEDEENLDYYYSGEHQGENVLAYVIDTGIAVNNPDFQGRAMLGPNFSTDFRNVDYIGHGTHVAGILGSKTYGVAKKLQIMSVKVLDRHGGGSLSSVIEGLEFAVNHMKENGIKAIANLSLGASKSGILDSAVQAAYEQGLLVVVAAGNNNMDACHTSPAGSPYSLTVGAINDKTDEIAHFSNWGRCIDIFASGVEVESLNNDHDNQNVQVLSGTSMASPIVAGVAAILIEQGLVYNEVAAEIKKISIWDAIPKYSMRLRSGSPNIIVNNSIRVRSAMAKNSTSVF